jgi:hypothetical protein
MDHVAIAARDVDKAVQSLAESGLSPEIPAKDYDWGRSAYYRDPDGTQVELHQDSVDWSNAHTYYSAYCFNTTWDLIEKKNRTSQEDEEMIARALASVWHWNQRPDCKDTNLAAGYWQVSRVYALVGQADNARRYGQLSLEHTTEDQPFLRGYAYEALAHAEKVAGNSSARQEYLSRARIYATRVTDDEDRKLLEDDLAQIQAN